MGKRNEKCDILIEKIKKKGFKMNRTPKDFVRVMYKKGRTAEEARAIASNTYWKFRMPEIEQWIKVGEKIRKKKGKTKRIKIKFKKVRSN